MKIQGEITRESIAVGSILGLAGFALGLSLGLGELDIPPTLGLLSAPGRLLSSLFSWASWYIPLWLGAAAALSLRPRLHPRLLFCLAASIAPFILIAAFARVSEAPETWFRVYPVLETFGLPSLGLGTFLLTIFLCLLVARVSIALFPSKEEGRERSGAPDAHELRAEELDPKEIPPRLLSAAARESRSVFEARPRAAARDEAYEKAYESREFRLPELPPAPKLKSWGEEDGDAAEPARSAEDKEALAEDAVEGTLSAESASAQALPALPGDPVSTPEASPAEDDPIPFLIGIRQGGQAAVAPVVPSMAGSHPSAASPGPHAVAAAKGPVAASGMMSASASGPVLPPAQTPHAAQALDPEEGAEPGGTAGGQEAGAPPPGGDFIELRNGHAIPVTSVPPSHAGGEGGSSSTSSSAEEEAKKLALLRFLEKKKKPPYAVPSEGILTQYPDGQYWIIDDKTKRSAEVLRETLAEFNIEAEVTGIRKGPVITMFEILPAPGVRLSKIANLADNIALRLAASSVRIVAPIPGKHAVGIEVPNERRSIVSLREIVENESFRSAKMEVPVILGKDIAGGVQFIDLVQTPHLLIAGATGSGKSVSVNSIILSILFRRSPEEVKLLLIDPKIVELKLYNDIPHLLTPVITEPKRAFQALQYCICEMERRYAMLDRLGVRDIKSYNRKIKEKGFVQERLPYIIVIIDEFADLMATTGKELESTLARLAAMSRAVGIHLVLATQRPSIDVITGLIKANIPSRIAFMVASKFDSRIIIDMVGAEKLLGRGDMLFASAWDPFPIRMQGAYVSEEEVEKAVEFVKTLGEPEYIDEEIFIDEEEEEDSGPSFFDDGDGDPLFDQALEIVLQQGKASASYIQRKLKIGYNRAARIVELMEERGIVGPAQGSKPRPLVRNPEIAGRAGEAGHRPGQGPERKGSLLSNVETAPGEGVYTGGAAGSGGGLAED